MSRAFSRSDCRFLSSSSSGVVQSAVSAFSGKPLGIDQRVSGGAESDRISTGSPVEFQLTSTITNAAAANPVRLLAHHRVVPGICVFRGV